MEKTTESATEYYAFLLDDEEGDVDKYLDYEERVIELAVGAVDIGELTDKQLNIVFRGCKKEPAIKKFASSIKFLDKQSIPTNKETELKWLCNELTIDREEVLNTVLQIANTVRTAAGCESKNITPTSAMPMLGEQPPVIGYPYMTQAASGRGNPISAIEAFQESIEEANETPNINIEGYSQEAATAMENAVFRGTFRAMARFNEPAEEIPLEKVDRLKKEGWAWKDAVMEAYPDTAAEDLDLKVDEVRQQLKRYNTKSKKGII